MKGAVLRKVKSEKWAEQYESYTSGLRSGASITVDDSKLDGIDVKPSARPRLGMPGSDLQLNPMGEKPEVVNDPCLGISICGYMFRSHKRSHCSSGE